MADTGYSTQAAFFDYDNDGDLDCYILTNALESFNRVLPFGQKKDGSGKSTDRLYRNEGPSANGLPWFSDVSQEAGIQTEGWGLGIGIADLNQDGWMDIYCANDFQTNDLLWINNGDGTFTNRIASFTKHQSANSMGMDIADINNDGLPEIVNLDMMPEDNLRQKTMFSKPGYDLYQTFLKKEYQPQFVRNTLQLNRGIGKDGNPEFSEIGYLSGIYATDWSWAALLADFDNDGYRDLFVTNGYRKDVTNLDFTSYTSQSLIAFREDDENEQKEKMGNMEKMLGVKKSNFMFRNKGDLTFENATVNWGLGIPSYSNGAAYADFDNDGDLDIVVNNIDDEAFVFRNNLIYHQHHQGKNGYLRITLKGRSPNLNGYGAKVSLYYGQETQFNQHSPYRGYKSTVGPVLHFGLGKIQSVDSVKIEWPNGRSQTIHNVEINQTLSINEDGSPGTRPVLTPQDPELAYFSEVSDKYQLTYRHTERDFIDFKKNHLLPHKHSQSGPGIAVADLNDDGLDDVFIGGAGGESASIFYQQHNGKFLQAQFKDKISEDTGVLLFDADGDGDNDLYCVSGSSEFGAVSRHYQDRFYRNLGMGGFRLDTAALPQITGSGSCVIACDYDKDGDLDLFVGGRVSPDQYPLPPRSYLLRNNGDGTFEEITATAAPGLEHVGMVSSALWTDLDNDGWIDLLIVGEFMPITFFKNTKGTLRQFHPPGVENSTGWWNSLAGGDFDNDGDTDYIAGNLGLNTLYKASEDEPVSLYARDFDRNGTLDPILCRYIQGQEYPVHYRESMTDQMITLKKTFTSYEIYGRKTLQDIFSPEMLQGALVLKAFQMASVYIENLGNGGFKLRKLPIQIQLSPVFGTVVSDINNDGFLDIISVGNNYGAEPLSGRHDASLGTCMLGDGKGNFTALPFNESGFLVDGDAKGAAEVLLKNGTTLLIATQNQDSIRVFENSRKDMVIPVFPNEISAEIKFKNGQSRKHEFYYGNTYWSQSSRFLKIPNTAHKVTIVTYTGSRRELNF